MPSFLLCKTSNDAIHSVSIQSSNFFIPCASSFPRSCSISRAKSSPTHLALTHANPQTPHFLSSTSPHELRMSFAAPLASTFFSRIFRPFSTSPARSFTSETQSRNMSTTETATETATVAAGCFWGVEHLYRKHFGDGKGLLDAKVGYCGGLEPEKVPTYRSVCSGTTGRKWRSKA